MTLCPGCCMPGVQQQRQRAEGIGPVWLSRALALSARQSMQSPLVLMVEDFWFVSLRLQCMASRQAVWGKAVQVQNFCCHHLQTKCSSWLTLHIQELGLTVDRAARTSHATCTPASQWSADRRRRRCKRQIDSASPARAPLLACRAWSRQVCPAF